MDSNLIELKIFDQTILLLPQYAAFWVEKKALFVADLHLGKATAFQKMGIPLPEGALQADLHRLTHLIDRWKAKECMILGDLIHSKIGLTDRIIQEFALWLQQSPTQVSLILGNHDRSLKRAFPSSWNLQIYPDSLTIEPFYFSHFPTHHDVFFVWAGHLHPQILLKEGPDKFIMRCFQIEPKLGILPAFSSIVGGAYVQPFSTSRIFPTTGDQIFELPSFS
ncbi:MAG: ligase-associated DNA damage response endonuclease PdeM [Verrucomicrobia bacterium]|nr:ligase-associated DNA damage response endonuclease PdeM [Verrucomicrobiota bacterium]